MANHVPDVRFGSLADICSALGDVRFTSESGHVRLVHTTLAVLNRGYFTGALTALLLLVTASTLGMSLIADKKHSDRVEPSVGSVG
jgi:hypothetical protein